MPLPEHPIIDMLVAVDSGGAYSGTSFHLMVLVAEKQRVNVDLSIPIIDVSTHVTLPDHDRNFLFQGIDV